MAAPGGVFSESGQTRRESELEEKTMNNYRRGMVQASYLCRNYAEMLAFEKPDFATVALECAAIIDDAGEQALTIAWIGDCSCQELSSFLVKPEIDYTSGFPR